MRKVHRTSENRLFRTGMVLAKPVVVKHRFTYRELTLVFGVCVALIIALTVWSSRKNAHILPKNTTVSSKAIETPLLEVIKRTVSLPTSVEF